MSNPIVIEARETGMTFGRQTVLRDVNLRCAQGEFVSLVGPSGCGKSTLLRLVAGLDRPTDGSLRVAGAAEGERRREASKLGFVFQESTLLPWRTARQNIALPLELQGVDRQTQRRAVDDALRLIGLTEDDARKHPCMLSGGMRMRVSLARALVTEPAILLLDEPFAALDDLLRAQLNEELLALWASRHWTTLFVTHNVAEAVFLSQRVVVLGGQPSRCAAEIEIPFEYPRDWRFRATPEFAHWVAEVTGALRETAE